MAPTGKSRAPNARGQHYIVIVDQIHISIGKKLWHPQEKAEAPNARGQHYIVIVDKSTFL